ncbi:unnamed protein product [Lactuca virosa]|uniref:Secreted protein n=1 Tax=Lactuca virosa TaxID=75947 RepID=A0AAU9MFN9_9ASTR|nr:unnamed protein product [Lactuca virosa]
MCYTRFRLSFPGILLPLSVVVLTFSLTPSKPLLLFSIVPKSGVRPPLFAPPASPERRKNCATDVNCCRITTPLLILTYRRSTSSSSGDVLQSWKMKSGLLQFSTAASIGFVRIIDFHDLGKMNRMEVYESCSKSTVCCR